MRELVLRIARLHPALYAYVRSREAQQWEGARNFIKAMLWLLLALALTLNGSALRDRGYTSRPMLWALIISGFLLMWAGFLLAIYVTVKYVPAMARITSLRWLFFAVDYKLTRAGVVFSVAALVIGLAGMNTGNNLLFIIFSSLLAILLVSAIISWTVLAGIGLKLEPPDHIFARQAVMASLTLENQKAAFPSFSLTVVGAAPDKDAPKALAANGRGRALLREPVYFPYLPRDRRVTQAVELTFPRRGRYAQDAFQVSSRFPFGFLTKTRRVASANEVVVYPPVAPTEEFYEILPLITGEMESYYRGRGHDLYSIRDYQPSDSARSVDWKATAKAQGLKVREFTREDERRVELVFDSFLPAEAGADWEERFERGVTFCACLAWHFHEIDAEMKFRSPEWETRVEAAGEIIYDVLHHLALIEPAREADGRFLQQFTQETGTFKIILTARPRGSIPTSLWTSSYFVFLDSL